MKSTLATTALLALGGGVFGGFLAMLFLEPSAPAVLGTAELSRETEGEEWLARLEQLELENQSLQASLSALQGLSEIGVPPRQRESADEWVALADFTAWQKDVLDRLRELESRPNAPQIFQEEVADAVSALRKQEMAERYRNDAEKRIAGVDQSVERMSAWLDLTADQSNLVREVLVAREQRNQEMIDLWRSGADDEAVGERKRNDAALYDTEMVRILSPQQLETFRAGGKAPK